MENEIRYFSMFTGVGGFELGVSNSKGQESWRDESASSFFKRERLQQKQFSCVGFSEIDKYASELLKKRFPKVRNYGDATKINPIELPDFDMLCGGFPCQAFSIAGKRRGFKDTRGTMFFEVARILEIKRPKIVFLENVKGLLNHNKGKTFRVILQTLSELGYDVQWMVLNSKFFGVPQNRERVFIIGSLRGEPRPEILPFRQPSGEINERHTEKQIASSLQHPGHSGGNYRGMNMLQIQKIRDGGQGNRIYSSEGVSTTIQGNSGGQGAKTGLYAVLTPDRENKRQNGRRFKDEGESSFTLTGQDIHGVVEGMKIRRLTPTECERLQGFLDGWTEGFSDTQRYKMMGNAVTVNVVSAIASKLFQDREGN